MTTKAELPERWATPQLIEWARQEIGLSPDEAAKRAKVSVNQLRAWEAGTELPTLDDLQILAEMYDCPVGYFFLKSPPQQEPPRFDFRGIARDKVSTLTYQTRVQLRRFTRLVDQAAFLISRLESHWETKVPVLNLEDQTEAVVAAAMNSLAVTWDERSRWLSSEDAFEKWRAAIERQGVFVISLRLDPGELRGASLWNPPQPPAILVNHADNEAATGRIFTLLHEYAHLVGRATGVVCDFGGQVNRDHVEQLANRFAAEAMVPKAEFMRFLESEGHYRFRQRWGDDMLDRLRTPFRASRDTVAILLEDLSLAPRGFYRVKRASWDKRLFRRGGRGGGLSRARQRLRELGLSFAKLLADARMREVISPLDLAELLDMRVEQAETLVTQVRGM